MSKVRDDEIHWWLREAAEETVPTDPKPAPAQQQHPQHPEPHYEATDDGSSNID